MMSHDARRWRISLWVVVGLLATIVAGEVRAEEPEFVPLPAQGRAKFEPTDRELLVPERFRMAAHEFDYTAEELRTVRGVRVFKVGFPSPVKTDILENNTVPGVYFQPAGAGPFPGVIVLHILGGDFELSQTIANSLARRGVAAIFLKMPYYGERRGAGARRRMVTEDPVETVAGMTQGVLDIRQGAAWLASRPEVDPARLGVQGISLGGIMASLSGAAEPRFGTIAIHLAGGNLSRTIWDLQVPEAGKFRERWLAAGGTRETFVETLAPIDPLTYAPLLKGRKILIVAAREDEVFPTESTVALWEAIGQEPELIWLEDAGHYTALRYILREIDRISGFFAEK